MFDFEAEYNFQADLDQFFADGDYTITFNTVHNGTQTVTLSLAGASLPNAPTVSNFGAAQAVDSTQPFTLTWEAFVGGTVDDLIQVEIERDFGLGSEEVFESPEPGEPGALDGTATSITIPEKTFAPGRSYEVQVTFIKVLDTDTSLPEVTALARFVSETELELKAAGELIRPSLEALGFTNNQFQLRLKGEREIPYTIESTSSLSNPSWAWTESLQPTTPVATNAFMAQADFSVIGASETMRFYRVKEGQ